MKVMGMTPMIASVQKPWLGYTLWSGSAGCAAGWEGERRGSGPAPLSVARASC
jgi:hypothetical protein